MHKTYTTHFISAGQVTSLWPDVTWWCQGTCTSCMSLTSSRMWVPSWRSRPGPVAMTSVVVCFLTVCWVCSKIHQIQSVLWHKNDRRYRTSLSRLSWLFPETSVNFKRPFVLGNVRSSSPMPLLGSWRLPGAQTGADGTGVRVFPDISRPQMTIHQHQPININPIAVKSRNDIRGVASLGDLILILKSAKVALEAVDKFVALATLEDQIDQIQRVIRTDSPTPGILRLGSSGFSQVDGGAGLSMIHQGSQGTSRLRRSIRLPGGSSIAAFCTSASLHCRNLIQKSTPCPALMLKHTAVCKESTHRTNILAFCISEVGTFTGFEMLISVDLRQALPCQLRLGSQV